MIVGLVLLLVIFGMGALVVRTIQRRDDTRSAGTGTAGIRRIFQYATLFGVFMVVMLGVAGLLEEIFSGSAELARESTLTARWLAFVVVGVPVYVAMGAWVRKLLVHSDERTSLGWSFYLTAALLTSAIATCFAAFDLLVWAFGAADFEAGSLARLVVWGTAWVAHWLVAARYLDLPRGAGHVLAGSLGALAATASFMGFTLAVLLDAVYADLFESGVANGLADDLARGGAGLLVGGVAWWFYWLRHGTRLGRTTMWNAFVMLGGVLTGIGMAVGSGATLLYSGLEWWLGDPGAARAVDQFAGAPATIAVGLVGLGLFLYHRAVLAEGATPTRTEIRRIYEYVLAGVGLSGLAGGITVLLVAVIRQLVPATEVVGGESDVNVLLAAVTYLVVGGPIWGYFWSRIQRIRRATPDLELRSPTRRVYLTLLFGIGGVAALVSLVAAAYAIFEDLLAGHLQGSTIADVAPGLALVITTGAMAGYHWLVFKEDRAEAPVAAPALLRDVILVGDADDALGPALRDRLDVKVQQWDRLDGVEYGADVDATVAELAASAAERVVVIGADGEYRIIPVTSHRALSSG